MTDFSALFRNPLIELLKRCDDSYTNTGDYYTFTEEDKKLIEPIVGDVIISTDNVYDRLYLYAKEKFGTDSYFQSVGAPISKEVIKRGGKVKLPFVMGSMTEAHLGDLEKWLIKNQDYVISNKLDGVSAGLVYENGKFVDAYSRGDGEFGANIQRHIINFDCVPKTIKEQGSFKVRGEVIIPKDKINLLLDELKEETGRTYANSRNTCAGMMNSEIAAKSFYKYAQFLAYQIEDWKDSEIKKFETLVDNGFLTPDFELVNENSISDTFLMARIQDIKANYNYECDGVIITINHKTKDFEGFESGTKNPKASRKFKVGASDEAVETKVLSIEWNCSKHGYLKPRVNIEPVQLDGATISWATGHNYQTIISSGCGVGAEVKISRRGLVIPYIEKVITPTNEFCLPDDRLWVSNGVDIMLRDVEEIPYELTASYQSLQLQQWKQEMVYFCQEMKVDQAGEGNIDKLMNLKTCYNIMDLIELSKEDFEETIGVNGFKFYVSLHSRLKDVNPAVFFDAVDCFGRGIGELKLQKILDRWGTLEVSSKQLEETEGFADITIKQYIEHMPVYEYWKEYIEKHSDLITLKIPVIEISSNICEGIVAVFTGVRDANIKEYIIKNGGKVVSSCTKECNLVIAKDVNSGSGKLVKAIEQGAEVISYAEALERFS